MSSVLTLALGAQVPKLPSGVSRRLLEAQTWTSHQADFWEIQPKEILSTEPSKSSISTDTAHQGLQGKMLEQGKARFNPSLSILVATASSSCHGCPHQATLSAPFFSRARLTHKPWRYQATSILGL